MGRWIWSVMLVAACASKTGETGDTGGGSTDASGAVNGCDPSTAEDHTSDSTVTVTTSGLAYSPACIKVAAGTTVTFESDFATHPLRGGTVGADGTKSPDASSPIPSTDTGSSVDVSFPDAGSYGYYCDVHASMGMKGAVFVQ